MARHERVVHDFHHLLSDLAILSVLMKDEFEELCLCFLVVAGHNFSLLPCFADPRSFLWLLLIGIVISPDPRDIRWSLIAYVC